MGYIKKFIAVVLTILMAILTLAFGCMLLPSLTGCASTGGGVDIETGVDTKVDTTPWLTPRPITIYEFNQTPDTIRHGFVYGDSRPFLWAYVSRQGVAVYSPLTGADIPTTPCTILTRRTR